VDAQTLLSRVAATDQATAAAEAKIARIGQRAAGFAAFEARSGLSLQQNEIANILGEAFGSDPAGKPVDPARRVDDHFKSLHDFVSGSDGKPAALETSLQKIQQLYQGFDQVASAPNQGQVLLNQIAGSGGGTSTAATQLQDLTRDMPARSPRCCKASRKAVTRWRAAAPARSFRTLGVRRWCRCASRLQPLPTGGFQQCRRSVDDFSRLLAPVA